MYVFCSVHYIETLVLVVVCWCLFLCVPVIMYDKFTLILGCYGDVLRVKILYNKKDSALVQFAESFQAQTGLCSIIYALCIRVA